MTIPKTLHFFPIRRSIDEMQCGVGNVSGNWKSCVEVKAFFQPVKDYLPRSNDDEANILLWPTKSEVYQIVAWSTFHKVWRTKYTNIKIRKKGQDTCTDCHTFLNKLRVKP